MKSIAFWCYSIPLLMLLPLARATTGNPSDSAQGFLFSYSQPQSSLSLPIIPACPGSLSIPTLGSLSNPAAGDPAPPYTLTMLVHEQLMDGAGIQYERMYAKSLNVGDMQNGYSTSVPWMNGTQMIGCMWAEHGVSGGCQDLVTVVSTADSFSAYANATSACRQTSVVASWVPPASSTLSVSIEHPPGALAANGWPLSCTDIKVTPLNGTGPYSLLVAPALHPPLNITGNGAMNYTVRLSHGQAFMLGLFDSAGNSWAYGPLHAGYSDDVACLGIMNGQTQSSAQGGGVGVGALAGGVVGAFVLGALGAVLLLWGCFLKKRNPTQHRPISFTEAESDPYASPPLPSTRQKTTSSMDSYLNPKPLDPHAASASPDPSYRNTLHHLSYGSPNLDHSGPEASRGTGEDRAGGELYDPYQPRPLGVGAGVGVGNSGTWPRTRGGHVTGEDDRGGSMGGRTRGYTSTGEFRDFNSTANSNPNRHSHSHSPLQPHTSAISRGRPSSAPAPPHLDSYSHASHPRIHANNTNQDPLDPRSEFPHLTLHRSHSPYDPNSISNSNSRSLNLAQQYSPPLGHSHAHPNSPDRPRSGRNVYVVHSDAGPEHDLHIRLPGAQGESRVIELPPDYVPRSGSNRTLNEGAGGDGNGHGHGHGHGREGTSGKGDLERQLTSERDNVSDQAEPRARVGAGAGAGAGHQETAMASRGDPKRRKSQLERMEAEYLGLDLGEDRERITQ